MKIIAYIEADTKQNWFGLRSNVCEKIGDKSLIRILVENISAIPEIETIAIVCKKGQGEVLENFLRGLGKSIVYEVEYPEAEYYKNFVTARKLNADSWRGFLNKTVFIEEFCPSIAYQIAQENKADCILKFHSHSPFVDKDLIREIISYYDRNKDTVNLVLTPCPPGLNYPLYSQNFLKNIAERSNLLEELFNLDTVNPMRDSLMLDYFMQVDEMVHGMRFRFCADTSHGMQFLRDYYKDAGYEGFEKSVKEISNWVYKNPLIARGAFPREIEIEASSTSEIVCSLCQKGRTNRKVNYIQGRVLEKIFEELNVNEGTIVSFEGFGEPLNAPTIFELIRLAREKNAFAIHLATDGRKLSEDVQLKLIDAGVDIVSVCVDAFNPDTYKKIKGNDDFQSVENNLKSFCQKAKNERIFVVPEITKVMETEKDIEKFFDKWFVEAGWCIIKPYDDYCGQIEDKSLIKITAGLRNDCKKLMKRMTIFSDCNVPVCREDFLGKEIVGNVMEKSISEIWNSERLKQISIEYQKGNYTTFQLCERCYQWAY